MTPRSSLHVLNPYGSASLQRLLSGERQPQRLPAVDHVGRHFVALQDVERECLKLVTVRLEVTPGEVTGPVLDDAAAFVTLKQVTAVHVDGHPAAAADHLGPDVITPGTVQGAFQGANGTVGESQRCHGSVEQAVLRQAGVTYGATDGMYLLDFADQEAGGVQVVDTQVDEDAAAALQELQGRRTGVPIDSAESFNAAELTVIDLPAGLLNRRVVTPLETNLHGRAGRAYRGDDPVRGWQVMRERLLHEHRFTCLDGLQHQLLVRRRGRAYDDRLDLCRSDGVLNGTRTGFEPPGDLCRCQKVHVGDPHHPDARDALQH